MQNQLSQNQLKVLSQAEIAEFLGLSGDTEPLVNTCCICGETAIQCPMMIPMGGLWYKGFFCINHSPDDYKMAYIAQNSFS